MGNESRKRKIEKLNLNGTVNMCYQKFKLREKNIMAIQVRITNIF